MAEPWQDYLTALGELILELNREKDAVQVRELPRIEVAGAVHRMERAKADYVRSFNRG